MSTKDFASRFAQQQAQLSHEEKVKENRRVFEMALAQIEFAHEEGGIHISCDGNQRNFLLEIPGVSEEVCGQIGNVLDNLFNEIREVSLQIGDCVMRSGSADSAVAAYKESKNES